jgi:L,D-transpeptidase ErfK/SrfK
MCANQQPYANLNKITMRTILAFMLKLTFGMLLFSHSLAAVYPLPQSGQDIIGEVFTIRADRGDNFDKIARRYGVGYHELVQANPTLNPQKIAYRKQVTIPAQYILPKVRQGIVINLAELRLYYFSEEKQQVFTYPVGIGREGKNTPEGQFFILQKKAQPEWRPPYSIKKEYASRGVELPDVVPAGPENPLGNHAMRLSLWSYLIHGTNHPESVGKRTSSGCISLFPEDIATLFEHVPLKTPVHITNDSFKLGWADGHLYLESVEPLSEQQSTVAPLNLTPLVDLVEANLDNSASQLDIDWEAALQTAVNYQGIPTRISML